MLSKFSRDNAWDPYVALAEREGVALWTAGRRLYNVLHHQYGGVRWIGDYPAPRLPETPAPPAPCAAAPPRTAVAPLAWGLSIPRGTLPTRGAAPGGQELGSSQRLTYPRRGAMPPRRQKEGYHGDSHQEFGGC
jgi:hypothetical protein